MAFAVKKIYKEGSPGANRARSHITLSAIKKVIKSKTYDPKNGRVITHAFYHKIGELGRKGHPNGA